MVVFLLVLSTGMPCDSVRGDGISMQQLVESAINAMIGWFEYSFAYVLNLRSLIASH